MTNPILLCTVGGAHQPNLEAIKSISPGYVCFFCTGQDPGTGRAGSVGQVTGQGLVIKAKREDNAPTLPNIPVQAGLGDGSYETQTVPADDLDEAYSVMRDAIARLAGEFPGARFVADYTGGTKTMTAALVCAAIERDDVELQIVAGARPDLVRVADGTEHAMEASVARLRLNRAMAPYLGAWQRFAYREAAEGLNGIRIAANDPDRTRLGIAQVLSRGLARWDDFAHAGALELIEPYAGRIAPFYSTMLPTLRLLAHERDSRHQPALLFDLWRNAERRAAQGRFDDAVARVYRLIEWAAQWQLRSKLGADTADFPSERLPANVDARPDRDGKIKLGLWAAWQVVEDCLEGPVRMMIAGYGAELRDLLATRNDSILAHGFRPVRQAEWDRMRKWIEDRFLPVLDELAKAYGLQRRPDQLPKHPPRFVGTTG